MQVGSHRRHWCRNESVSGTGRRGRARRNESRRQRNRIGSRTRLRRHRSELRSLRFGRLQVSPRAGTHSQSNSGRESQRQVKLKGTHELKAPRERVYQSLVNPEVLQRCIPGCEQLEKTAENTFSATNQRRRCWFNQRSIQRDGASGGPARASNIFGSWLTVKARPDFLKGSGDLNLEQDRDTARR